MTWLDWTAIAAIVICGAVGARLGSLWIGACLVGGFVGASLADTYAYAAAEYLGKFASAHTVAWLIVFLGGLALVLIPGFIVSKVGSAFFAGVIDSAMGMVAGAFAAAVVIVLIVFFALPLYPKFEKNPFWKNSTIVRPAYQSIEGLFEKKFLKKHVIASAAKQSVFQTNNGRKIASLRSQ